MIRRAEQLSRTQSHREELFGRARTEEKPIRMNRDWIPLPKEHESHHTGGHRPEGNFAPSCALDQGERSAFQLQFHAKLHIWIKTDA